MKIIAFILFVILLLVGCDTDSKQPPANLNKFAKMYEKGISVHDFRGYRIQKRGSSYLVGFPGYKNWFVYDYDKEIANLNLDNLEALMNEGVITNTNSNIVDSLNLEAFRRIVILSENDVIKADGKLDNNEVIEFSFNSQDVLAYISFSDDSIGVREDYLKNNAINIFDNWYFFKRDAPLDLSDY